MSMANFEWVSKAHRFIYHHSNGWIGGYLGRPMVLMYTIGAKTGLTRMVPLQYYPVGDEGILVLASNNGQPKAPAWYHNLKAHPDIEILVGRQRRRVHAEELSPERRAEVWPEMRRQNSQIEAYAARAGRIIPVMLLRTVTVH
jgi:deazaflavin-dependent oxidoreductase (nitroreductase family)